MFAIKLPWRDPTKPPTTKQIIAAYTKDRRARLNVEKAKRKNAYHRNG